MPEYVVGNVFHPTNIEFCAVIGVKFPYSDGYDFYVVGSNLHFSKEPDSNDSLAEIDHAIYDALYSLKGSGIK
jgi:hypothetical protein